MRICERLLCTVIGAIVEMFRDDGTIVVKSKFFSYTSYSDLLSTDNSSPVFTPRIAPPLCPHRAPSASQGVFLSEILLLREGPRGPAFSIG